MKPSAPPSPFVVFDDFLGRAVKQPLASLAIRLQLSANDLNLLGLAGCLVAAGLSFAGKPKAGAAAFLAFSSLDGIDGSVARRDGTADTNILGGWQDAFGGFVAETIFVCATALSPRNDAPRYLSVASVGLLSLSSYVKSVATEYAVPVDWADAAYLGRGLRITVISVTTLLSRSDSHRNLALSTYSCVSAVILVHRVRKILVAGKRNTLNKQKND